MSTINIDRRPLAGPPELPGVRGARSGLPGQSHEREMRGAGADRPADSHGVPAASEPVTGKVYALKDGSGYVALASDGHYYKLEPGGGGFTYAAASGPVDTSMVDVTHGPVRTLRRAAVPQPSGIHAHDLHLPGSTDRDASASGANRAAVARTVLATDGSIDPHVATDSGAHAGSNPDAPFAGDVGPRAPNAPASGGTDAAAAAARATHGLILRHPDAALRSHAGVSPEAVVALLR